MLSGEIEINSLKDFLEEKYLQYNNGKLFIESDPVSVPHLFTRKEDIEIAAFLTAVIAWGQRTSIIKNAVKLMDLMQGEPYSFIMNASQSETQSLNYFVHRTFNGTDCIYFIKALNHIYTYCGGLEKAFTESFKPDQNIKTAIINFRNIFLSLKPQKRSCKHIANPESGSSAKRINMFLRWMVRSCKGGVDFGLWNNIPPSALMMPLDVHSGNVARKLRLLNRKQNDWKAVEELTRNLRLFDPHDPVKYDFALFGLGIFEKF